MALEFNRTGWKTLNPKSFGHHWAFAHLHYPLPPARLCLVIQPSSPTASCFSPVGVGMGKRERVHTPPPLSTPLLAKVSYNCTIARQVGLSTSPSSPVKFPLKACSALQDPHPLTAVHALVSIGLTMHFSSRFLRAITASPFFPTTKTRSSTTGMHVKEVLLELDDFLDADDSLLSLLKK